MIYPIKYFPYALYDSEYATAQNVESFAMAKTMARYNDKIGIGPCQIIDRAQGRILADTDGNGNIKMRG